jgi:L,D-transpeptidase catalytic domain
LSWTPSATAIAPNEVAEQQAALFTPPAGTFTWTDRGWPGRLRRLWKEGAYTVFTKGLVMSFEADHGLPPNGSVGPALWNSLLNALASNAVNTGGYNYALANKKAPESFTVWHDGRVVLRSQMNTGISDSPTPDGNFPVFTRLRNQVMKGTNPDGAKYADPVQFVAYFHDNDAVHYMSRADYGIPQSLGCIELPLADAAIAWPYLAYGTLVTVIH